MVTPFIEGAISGARNNLRILVLLKSNGHFQPAHNYALQGQPGNTFAASMGETVVNTAFIGTVGAVVGGLTDSLLLGNDFVTGAKWGAGIGAGFFGGLDVLLALGMTVGAAAKKNERRSS